MAELSPFVYWAQTENNVSLKVDLKDVKVSGKAVYYIYSASPLQAVDFIS